MRSSPAGGTLFLWFPAPEPGTMVLFGTGLLLIGIIVRRKQLHEREGLIDG
jgi:hypothetical protein